MPRAEAKPVKIEVLKRVYGVLTEDAVKAAVRLERNGMQLRVMDPVTLLEAKLHNAVYLPQQNRQDVKHVRIMVLCVRAYLREQLAEVERGRLGARNFLDSLELVLQIAGSRRAATAARKYGIKWTDVLPLKELAESRHAKLRNFSEKRLPQWLAHQQRPRRSRGRKD